ncbi:MAG: plasmid recombination protein, partial [Endomicrobia bacterium]|nr:plasmid recombination protein [Endomicrobiia bacterium]
MAHCKKYNKAACGHMFKHYERAKDQDGEYLKFGNQDIDISRSHLNYNLAPIQPDGQGAFVKKRCSEVKMQNRADVNVMCSWVVTAPQTIRPDETEKFFKEAYNFLSERYGKDNVISAHVHMDETTPHIHFAFVPVVMDKKKNILKVSAKELLDKKELQTFHNYLSAHMEKAFGRNVGILNEATTEGNRTVEELKRGTAQKELAEIKQQIEELKIEETRYVRDGNLARAAEVKHGKIPEAQKKLKVLTDQMEGRASGEGKAGARGDGVAPLLREEVSEEDIAQVVSVWTGIPVAKMLSGE